MRLILAPMEGVIDHTMRALLTSLGGLDRCVTEFVRVTDQLLPARVFYRFCPELKHGGVTASGVPVYVQILGGKPLPMAANAARAAELGAPGIDINFGCPAKTVNRNDGGSVLLREPERVHAIVDAVRRAVPWDIPVTVKMRLGFEDTDLFEENVRAIAAANPSELIVHARTKKHGYRPPAYWEEIARAREWTRIPIIANGEVWNPNDARSCLEQSNCEDLMLGRGILCRPDLARLVKAESQSAPIQALTWPEVQALVLRLLNETEPQYDARHVGNPIKQWLSYQRHYYPQAAVLFETIKRLHDPAEIRHHLLPVSDISQQTA